MPKFIHDLMPWALVIGSATCFYFQHIYPLLNMPGLILAVAAVVTFGMRL